MKRSKFMNSAEGVDVDVRRASRYGLSEEEWSALTTEEREIHYNRQNVCEHPYAYNGPDNAEIRLSWSFDPYAHTAHLFPHDIEKFRLGTCECHTCLLSFGVTRKELSTVKSKITV